MSTRWIGPLWGAVVLGVITAAPAAADQALSFNLGLFALQGEDGRSEEDVLRQNLTFLRFDIGDLNGAALGADWLIGLGPWFEGSVGAGFHRGTASSTYAEFVNEDGSEIRQELKLRVVPISASVRVFPLGRDRALQPYVGAGVAILPWRYSETGDFVNFATFEIFRDSFVDSGTAVGPEGLFGLRYRMTDSWGAGGELRVRGGTADLDPDPDLGFAGTELDLGGYTTTFTLQYHF